MSAGEKDEGEQKPMTEPTEIKSADAGDKRQQTQAVLADILRLMGYPATLDFKDAADGGLSVAMHFEVGEVPFATAGKRSFVIDSMQFLVNKVVNRPNTEKRWVSLGVGEHPAPRSPRSTPLPGMTPVPGSTPAPAAPMPPNGGRSTPTNGMKAAGRDKGPPMGSAPRPAVRAPHAPHASHASHAEEPAAEVKADPQITALGAALAEKAVKHGRYLGVVLMDTDDRTRLLKAAQSVKGQSTRVEGEGHNRRVVFSPDKPVPMPKKTAMPVFDDEEDSDE